MKTLVLIACLVAAATVSAAELKDPAEVSKDWSKTIEQSLVAQAAMPDFRSLSPNPLVVPERAFKSVPAWEPKKEPSPFEGLIRPPEFDPKRVPKGAKPYQFNGETYWIIPIAHEADA